MPKTQTVKESIVVDCPISTVYNQWTQFEEFPEFMENVHEVRQLDDKNLEWRAEVGGKEKTWVAEITEQVPDQRITWKSTEGTVVAGTVTFREYEGNKCLVTLKMSYRPDTFFEKMGAAFGAVKSNVKGDLERFKDFIEERQMATGAWRGTIPKQTRSRRAPLRARNKAKTTRRKTTRRTTKVRRSNVARTGGARRGEALERTPTRGR